MITVFIPAKGHSERVNSKNLQQIAGKTLIQRALDFAEGIERVSRIVLSTDSIEIVSATFLKENIALEFKSEPVDTLIPAGKNVYIHKRSSDFSAQDSRTTSLLTHYLGLQPQSSGHILLLQPTSPFRLESDTKYINSLDLNSLGSFFSVLKVESPHPLKTFQWDSGSSANLTDDEIVRMQTPAQTLGEYFAPDGAFYMTSVEEFLKSKSLINKQSICYERNGHRTINIDTEGDLDFARYVAENAPHKL
jgi:CMP-N,N'-diacetyllegionaminic acid synthase